VTQVIAEIFLEVDPKVVGACRVAVQEDDGKEIAHAMSGAHMRGIPQALDPFIIVVKQTPALTRFLESLADDPIKCPKVFV
jgi:hypothetical protein